jgi:predicted membrane GTPase involved in stress response
MNMLFTINNSPFFGKEGKFVTSRHLRDRLFKETEKNLALRVKKPIRKILPRVRPRYSALVGTHRDHASRRL